MAMYRDARNMSISAFLATALIAVRSILVLEIVGPETIGIWKSAMVLFFACEFVRLGLPTGIGLRLPVLLGQRNSGEAEQTVRAAGSALIVMGAVVGLLIFGGSFLVDSGQYRLALWFVALIIAFSFPQAVLREIAGAQHLFAVRVKEALLEAVVNFVATLVLASMFGLAGLGTAVVLSTLLPALYLWWRLKMPVTVRFAVPRLLYLIWRGAAVLVHGVRFPRRPVHGGISDRRYTRANRGRLLCPGDAGDGLLGHGRAHGHLESHHALPAAGVRAGGQPDGWWWWRWKGWPCRRCWASGCLCCRSS